MGMFRKAEKKKLPARIGLAGLPGAGKTLTALLIAQVQADKIGKRVAVINTETYAAEKYAGETFHGVTLDFDLIDLRGAAAPEKFTAAMNQAVAEGYGIVIADSMTHAWLGTLKEVDKRTLESNSKNSFFAWKTVTPRHNELIETVLNCPIHVILTLRQKQEYAIDTQGGKAVPTKVGLSSVFREGIEYEVDLFCDIDQNHLCRVTKSRCRHMPVGSSFTEPGPEFFEPFFQWLDEGEAVQTMDHVSYQQISQQAASPPAGQSLDPPFDPNPQIQDASVLASAERIAVMKSLFDELSVPVEHRAAMLSRRNLSAYEQMTGQQVEEVVQNLLAQKHGIDPRGGDSHQGTPVGDLQDALDARAAGNS